MIRAEELRIGNYVYSGIYSNKVIEVYPMFFVQLFKIEDKEHNIKPIPLTEEWLLKFGFIKSNLDGDNAWLNLRYRFLNFASDESVNFEKVYLTVNKMDIICSYVHQLQNLYFALTNKELTYDKEIQAI